ncbi:putative efflux protein, MATE family [Hathewaya proteolytica DSM 3090]|uniref:Multidrug export protein MepA n=1 Tax=Hathewaya proteolytica DSM 3090 TaxID=1121331 RepID=A0A1M6KYV4_9CLOT|nr:MATE family efflux transporter [Hathewaya proteolytica]SHJ64130.1 putative efflux protein, MATE family [Hathewaya proteolytica DSM 3090]
MEYDNSKLGTENVKTLLHRLAIPAIISLMVAKLYNVIDTVFLGKTIGNSAIGALTIALPIQTLMVAVAVMIAAGSSAASARAFGANNEEKAQKIAGNGIITCIIISICMTGVIYVFLDKILMFLGNNEELLPFAKEYMSIVLFGGILNVFTIVLPELITSSGNSRISMKATIIGALCNIVLDFVFVIVFPYGIKGAAVATVISQALSSAYAIKQFFSAKSVFKFKLKYYRMQFSIIKEIVVTGISAFIIDMSDALMVMILNKVIGHLNGTEGIVIVGVITKVYLFMDIAIIGITTGMQPITSYNYGALRFNRLANVLKYALKLTLILASALWLLQMIFAENIVSLFLSGPQSLIKESAGILRMVLLIYPLNSIYFTSTYFYQSIGKSKKAISFSIMKQIFIFCPLVSILGYGTNIGFQNIWIAFPITDIIVSLVSLIYLKRSLNILSTKKITDKAKRELQYSNL